MLLTVELLLPYDSQAKSATNPLQCRSVCWTPSKINYSESYTLLASPWMPHVIRLQHGEKWREPQFHPPFINSNALRSSYVGQCFWECL